MRKPKQKIDRRVVWAEKRRAAGFCITCGNERLHHKSKHYGEKCLEKRRGSYHVAKGRPVPKRKQKKSS